MTNRMWRARVITCSDAASAGNREDRSGPAVRALLIEHGYQEAEVHVVPDSIERISQKIIEAADRDGIDLIITTGGTGIAPSDVTPEATALVTHRSIPGLGELMRTRSLEKTPMAALSRAGAAVRGSALVVNLPGSVAGATENLQAILQLIPHALELLSGERIERHPTGKD